MNRYCKKTGVGLVPWGPVAGGTLTRPAAKSQDTARGATSSKALSDTDVEIVNRVEELAKTKGWSMAQVAFVWSKSKTTSPILGISSEDRLKEFVDAVDFELTADEIKHLEEPYQPKPIQGFDQGRTTS